MTGVTRPSDDYVESSKALAILDVKPQTLYSYVSRGLIRRIAPNGRSSFYNREDIQRLKARSKARAGHGAVAESAMHWGEPVLSTSITEITAQGPRYRAHLALDLVRDEQPIEAVAEYLWSGTAPAKTAAWPVSRSAVRMAPQLADLVARYPELHAGHLLTEAVLLHAIDREPSRHDIGRSASLSTARALVQVLCGASGLLGPKKTFIRQGEGESIASVVARALGVGIEARKVRAINAVFVLLADHEFTPATFAARIAASAGVDLHSCVGAALQVHFGAALGLRCDRIEQELLRQPSSVVAISNRRVHAELVQTGFSHPLYINGDPRAQKILELAMGLKEYDSAVRATRDRLEQIESGDGRLSLDAALVVFCRALGIDKPMAGGLLALGRAVGWIAHVIEQRQQDFMIRPRGRFTAAATGATIRAA
jgi:citrate synthase